MMVQCHEVERVENLMYEGCESHWHCIHCNDYWPFHCYGKKDLEQMACPIRSAQAKKDSGKEKKTGFVPMEKGWNRMKRTIELDQDDIRKAIATAYNVQPQDVRLDLFHSTVGYGMSEREVPDVRATISVDPSVRM